MAGSRSLRACWKKPTTWNLRPDFAIDAQVPYLDAAMTLDEQNAEASVFMLNRDLENARELELDFQPTGPSRIISCDTLTGPDLKAVNTFEDPGRVVPQSLEAVSNGQKTRLKLPPASYSVLRLAFDNDR